MRTLLTGVIALGLSSLGLTACGPSAEDIATNLTSNNPVVREDSAKMARQHDDEVIIVALQVALNDPSDEVRLNAVESLAELEAVEAVPALIAVVQADGKPEVVSAAVDALGRIADPRAVSVLMAHLEQKGASRLTLNAIWALGNIGDGHAMPLLARIREGSDDPYIVYSTERALRLLKPVAAEPAEGAATEATEATGAAPPAGSGAGSQVLPGGSTEYPGEEASPDELPLEE